jgi:hypothetical protein
MRKCCAIVLLVLFSWIGGLGQDARAGVTLDVLLFQDATVPSGLTIVPGDPGPGFTFTGYYGGSVSTTYDSDNGLPLEATYEWKGIGVSFAERVSPNNSCLRPVGLLDSGGVIGQFGCLTGPPFDAAVFNDLFYGVVAIIDGNIVALTSADIMVGSVLLHLNP